MPRTGRGRTGKILKRILICVLSALSLLLIAVAAYEICIRIAAPAEFMIPNDHYFDYQARYECSGYASAYALRSLGEDVAGPELYARFSDKNPDGTLAPGYLWENLKAAGYGCSLRTGSLASLKYQVSKGTPVIALIRLNAAQPYLHYVPVVGYDAAYIYVADSLRNLVNAENENYNRAIAVEEFEQLWKTDAFAVDFIFLTVWRR